MKLNWGSKIALFYGLFVAFIIGMVIMAFGEKYDLVTEDYYQQELEYQSKIDKSSMANALGKKVQIKLKEQNLEIELPHLEASGSITFFRPSDENADFTIAINLDQGVQSVPLKKFRKGKYRVKIDWTNQDKAYYQETSLIIP